MLLLYKMKFVFIFFAPEVQSFCVHMAFNVYFMILREAQRETQTEGLPPH